MKFYIKNKENAEAGNDLKEPHIIISINFPRIIIPIDKDEEVAVPATNEYTKEVLSLFFSDVGRLSNPYDDDAKSNPRCVPFNKEMACQVIDLLERNKVEHIIVHCLGGASRSPSLAGALSMYFNDENSRFIMNDLVYQVMLETLVEYYGSEYDQENKSCWYKTQENCCER